MVLDRHKSPSSTTSEADSVPGQNPPAAEPPKFEACLHDLTSWEAVVKTSTRWQEAKHCLQACLTDMMQLPSGPVETLWAAMQAVFAAYEATKTSAQRSSQASFPSFAELADLVARYAASMETTAAEAARACGALDTRSSPERVSSCGSPVHGDSVLDLGHSMPLGPMAPPPAIIASGGGSLSSSTAATSPSATLSSAATATQEAGKSNDQAAALVSARIAGVNAKLFAMYGPPGLGSGALPCCALPQDLALPMQAQPLAASAGDLPALCTADASGFPGGNLGGPVTPALTLGPPALAALPLGGAAAAQDFPGHVPGMAQAQAMSGIPYFAVNDWAPLEGALPASSPIFQDGLQATQALPTSYPTSYASLLSLSRLGP